MIRQNREIKHILFSFRIQRDTSSWPGNCTEISGASRCLKRMKMGPRLEGYWFKPLTPPAPRREERTSSASSSSAANVEVPVSKAIIHCVLKWNDFTADMWCLSLFVSCSQMWTCTVEMHAGNQWGRACSARLWPDLFLRWASWLVLSILTQSYLQNTTIDTILQ